MVQEFTEEDRDRNVVTAGGDPVGVIHEVEGDRATIKREQGSDVADEIEAMLGWEDADEHELQTEHVDAREDDQIRLLGAQDYANL